VDAETPSLISVKAKCRKNTLAKEGEISQHILIDVILSSSINDQISLKSPLLFKTCFAVG
jgi:hypothetical protein